MEGAPGMAWLEEDLPARVRPRGLLLGVVTPAVLLAAGAAAAQGPSPTHPTGTPLTAASGADALDVGLGYLQSRRAAMGLAADDLDELVVTDRYETPRTGATHLYLRQQIDGIEVDGAEITLTVDARGRLRAMGDRLVRHLRARVGGRTPVLAAADAVLAAAGELGLAATGPLTEQRDLGGVSRAAELAPAGLSRDPIPVKLVYAALDSGAVRLAWNAVIRTPDGRHWWNLYVDARTGELLRKNDWIARESYEVHGLPLASPDDGPRTLEVDPADPVASPLGWHDTDGIAGAEFTDTRGNNVFAQDDLDADDAGGSRPDGGPGLLFDFPLDLTLQPGNHLDASIANLFYWNNVAHDVMYRYGFDEAAGNFQLSNYGAGGLEDDPVSADAQDGAATNNAQFGTPPDGSAPVMEMFRWLLGPSPRLVVSAPPAVAGTYFGGMALFGGGTPGLAGTLVQALDPADGAGPSTTDACSPLTNPGAVAGNLAIVDRGSCFFVDKVGHAQDAGAIGVVIVNNAGDDTVNMAGVDPSLTIPALFLGQSDGALLVAQLGAGVTASLVSRAARDSALDNTIVVHEYGHGVSNRLTGGPSNTSCLDVGQSRAMGEGWSDWWALVFTAKPGDTATDARGIGNHVVGLPPSGGGIRNFPYSTDPGISPLTYGDIGVLNQPHGAGEVWAGALWEMYWNLVATYGFDPDLYGGTGGNNLALQLVMDALKLQPCDPTYVDARDAVLLADAAANGGANECAIWAAFAKRGLGVNASDGGSAASLAVSEDFDVPPVCLPEPGPAALLLSGGAWLRVLARRRGGR